MKWITPRTSGEAINFRRKTGIEVTALHNHMLDDEPRLFFMHSRANGDAAKLVAGLRRGLDQINLAGS